MKASEPIRVLVVDDHRVVREGLRSYLELVDEIEMVGEASDGRAALDYLARAKAQGSLPDVVIENAEIPIHRNSGRPLEGCRWATQL